MHSFSELAHSRTKDISNIQLYRTFGIERLFQLLSEKKLALLEPSKWDDPYERALQNLVTSDNPEGRPGVFGLCWTTQARSDALWRIYSPTKLGVRISTTVGRLYEALVSNTRDNIKPENLFLGRVSYLPERSSKGMPFDFGKFALGLIEQDFRRPISNIADAIEDMIATDPSTPRDVAKALYLKRTPFDHEKEVRLLYVDMDISAEAVFRTNGVMKLDLDPFSLIRGIQFDPRVSDDIYEALKSSVKSVLGSRPIRISKSSLYKDPMQILSAKKK